MIRLVDDQILGRLLREEVDDAAVSAYTTGYWYVRLSQAVLGAAHRSGVLSGPFAPLPESLRRRALRNLIELPESIGLLSLRSLAPRIGELRRRHQLNILGMEVVAAAIELDAHVSLSARSPQLERALLAENIEVDVGGERVAEPPLPEVDPDA